MNKKWITVPALLVCCFLVSGASLAAVVDEEDLDRDTRQVILVDEDGDRVTISLEEGPVLRIVSAKDDEVVEIDLSDIEKVVAEAVDSVNEALEDMSEVQVDIQLGRHNRCLVHDDQDNVVIDVGEIIEGIGRTLEHTFVGLEREIEKWTRESLSASSDGDLELDLTLNLDELHRNLAALELPELELELEHHDLDTDELREELAELRQEMARLQDRLRERQQRARH